MDIITYFLIHVVNHPVYSTRALYYDTFYYHITQSTTYFPYCQIDSKFPKFTNIVLSFFNR